jgi:hypothetical protein
VEKGFIYIVVSNLMVSYIQYLRVYSSIEFMGRYSGHWCGGNYPDDDDVYLEYYSGKEFHINYSCIHVLGETHKLVQ